MKRTMLMILSMTCLTACAGLGMQSPCEGPSSRPVTIHYGDSELRVTPPIRTVHRNGDFVLRLNPSKRNSDSVDYADVSVTVVGKAGAAWISSKSNTYKDAENRRIVYCVPRNQAYGEYSYEVTVADVGSLDPRVEVRD